MSLLELRDVGFAYRPELAAVQGVSATFRAGQLVAIIGPNGAGKSTLLKLMARVLDARSGSVLFEGAPVESIRRKEYARRVGYLPQEPEPAFPMRAIDVVVSGRAPFLGRFEWESDRDFARARRALAECDAEALEERFLDEMSGGERKRVFLARVLAGDPRLVLLDEPLSALDVAHTQGFTRLLRQIVDATGKTVIFISHDLNWSAAYSDRMLVISGGRLVLDSTPGAVMRPEVMKQWFGFDGRAVAAEGGVDLSWIVPDAGRHKP